MTPRLPAGLFCCALLAACGNPAAQHTVAAPAASGTPAPASAAPAAVLRSAPVDEAGFGGDFTLTGADGQAFSLGSLKGKAVVLAFGFTNCPDVCPTELFIYSETLSLLGSRADEVAVVFVSVDPERDTPELVGRYVRAFHPGFIGLTDEADGKRLQAVKRQYRVVSAKSDIKSDRLYNVDHSAGAYLLDKTGRTVLFAPYGIEAPQLAEDLKTLLDR